jgi:hypothetical protein
VKLKLKLKPDLELKLKWKPTAETEIGTETEIRTKEKTDIAVRFFSYFSSAAKALSRIVSTGPTPAIFRYCGAPGCPELAQSL